MTANGTIASDSGCGAAWCYAAAMPQTRTSPAISVINGNIYIYGAQNASGALTSNTYFAPIMSSGTLGSWQTTASFTTGRYFMSGAAYGGYIYLLGGCSSGACITLLNDVQYAPLQSIPRIGHYSRVLDSDVDVTPTKGIVRGSKATVDSLLSLSLVSAPSATSAFGSTQAPTINFGSLFNVTVGSNKQARYYRLTLTLDDTASATFPDAPSQQSVISSFDVFYHPNTAKRLRGGKTFTGGKQQSLDAQP